MKWYNKYISTYNTTYDPIIHKNITLQIKEKITKLQADTPIVTVSVIAYNEEKHLLSCLWSLSDMVCKYPIEIIGVDNDSKDKTAQIFKSCGIPFYTESQHSCGYARLCGLNNAKGKYHINIDADTMYPPHYVELMVNELEKKNVVGVSSLWSYIPDKHHSRFGLFIYENFRDMYLFLQSFKRPELSVRGLVFAYNTSLAKETGIRTDIIRGEDGSLALALKKYGKIHFIRNKKARPITGYGTVAQDGSLWNSFVSRFIKGIKNISHIFTKKEDYKDEDSNIIKS